MVIRGHLRRSGGEPGSTRTQADEVVEIDPRELTGLFTTPGWLRDLGLTSWLLVGVTLLLVGVVWLMSLTYTIVLPVITAAVVAAVASPVLGWLGRHRVPRALGAALLLLSIVLLAAALVVVIVGGIASQADNLSGFLSDATNTIEGWLKDLGVSSDSAKSAAQDGGSSASTTVSALLLGLGGGIQELSSLFFFLALTALSLFFLLKDGPAIRGWGSGTRACPCRWPARSRAAC